MITKPEKTRRNYIPISFADSLQKINKKFLYKFGKLDYIIHTKWHEIVGDFFVKYSEPEKITSIPSKNNDNEVYKLGGSYNVGTSANSGLISLEDARLELKYYLRDSYKINLQSGIKAK